MRVPTTTWVRLGSSSSSRVPAPKPLVTTRMGGRGPNPPASADSRAAPVGVVSSTGMSRPQVGMPSSSATTAGAGLGSMPWAVRTIPMPVATGLDSTSSTPRTSRAAMVPTTSTMVS